MQLSYLALNCHERGEHKQINRCDSSIQDVIDDIHLVDPLLVDFRIPEELHHDTKLRQLRNLAEQDQTNVQPQSQLVDSQPTTFG